ncbi:hypothetical protein [Simiduia agarivorans]|uniref:Uncharacterized protein n=1 Tax=Simiduia agarivorans (strain DSM 21679 / JCM 13881 / BCRC 17597 / SA1) TaxID=1117647 RepID=K4KLA1_SIMAS|nr:hypothetical protein [Simiduia agarivorans]AFU98833.1 hypothetical protein M5M_08220 [Simiduia agarivorans SA1 = DSM 21679]
MDAHKRLAAVLIVAFSALTGGTWMLAGEVFHGQPNYHFIRVHADALVVNFGSAYVWLDTDGRERSALDLSDAGMMPVGDFLILPDGDLLVYHQPVSPGLFNGIMRFLRIQETSDTVARAGEGFYRCDTKAVTCAPFALEAPALHRNFRLWRDDESGHIFLVHTGAFVVYQFSSDGKRIAQSRPDQFRFPNQLIGLDDALWLADTNNHRLVKLSRSTPFAAELETMVVQWQAPHLWPHQLAWDQKAGRFLVLLGDNDMANGLLVSVDDMGIEPLAGMDATDPMAITLVDDTLWLTDFSAGELHRYRLEGNQLIRLPAPAVHTLRQLESARMHARQQARQWQWMGGLGFGLVFIAGLIIAWRLEKPQALEAFARWRGRVTQSQLDAKAAPVAEREVIWIANNQTRYLPWRLPVVALVLATLMAGGVYVLMNPDQPHLAALRPLLTALGVMLLPMLALLVWVISYHGGQRLGVTREALNVYLPSLPFSPALALTVPFESIRFNARHLIAGKAIVVLGSGQMQVFDAKQLARYLWPRLQAANAIAPSELGRELLKRGHPLSWLPVVAALWALACMALLVW